MNAASQSFARPVHNSVLSFKNILLFAVCIAIPVMVGLGSGYITKDNMVVFDAIRKPLLTPPAFVFPIAWSILYVLMGIASFVAIINCWDGSQRVAVMIPYVIQLILNFAWSLIFFNMQNYGLALVCLALMWIMIVRTMMSFSTVSILSTWFLFPYILWVSFALYLNLMIVIMN